MDLVDIDQVLDNLELHEEEANEKRKVCEDTKPSESSAHRGTTNGFVSSSKEAGFKAVSQVFNSLDDYCKNVESLEPKVLKENQCPTVLDIPDKVGFQPSELVASSRQELEEYEYEVEESKDIQRFTEKPRNMTKLSNDMSDKESPESINSHSSESLTTSSNSTFSSGPSLDGESSVEGHTPLSNSREVVMNDDNLYPHREFNETNKEQVSDNEQLLENCDSPRDSDPPQLLLMNKAVKEEVGKTEISQSPEDIEDLESPNVEDLTQGLSSISLTSANLQSQSILPLESSLSSLSLGQVLENLTDSNVTTSAIGITKELPRPAHDTTQEESSEAANTSVEVLNAEPVPDIQLQPQMQQQIYDYNQAKYDEMNSAIQQPVTFCSTMDDISDAELDSMLQEMDIDDEAVVDQPLSQCEELKEELVESREFTLPQSKYFEHIDNLAHDPSDDILSNTSSGDHPNGDSFSQASTVEFSEMRPQNLADIQDLPECDDNIAINSAVSSYSNSESSSLEGDLIQAKNIDLDDPDPSRPQRPTSLDLPAIQALDLYANAGQTPPGGTEPTQPHEPTEEVQTPSPDVEPEASPIANDIAEATGYSEDPNANLGKIPPIWVPDNMASGCMQCSAKFTMIKRRHHCRACGKVLCSVCCSQKFNLDFLNEPESRVCVQCYLILTQRQTSQSASSSATNLSSSSSARSPNPNNPMEYCSTIPPHRQVSTEPKTPPTVIVPVGVLKKDNGSYSSTSSNSSGQKARKRKSVMFSDGIAPGSDLASIDQWNEPKQARRQSDRASNRNGGNNKPSTPRSEYIADATTMGLVAQLFRGSIPPMAAAATMNAIQSSAPAAASKTSAIKSSNSNSSVSATSGGLKTPESSRAKRLPPSGCDDQGCFIPDTTGSLPPIVIAKDESGCDFDYKDVANNYELVKRLQNETLKFAVQKNFFIFVKIVNLKCCLNRTVINFTTSGMHHVGNDEIIILLEFEPPTSKEEAGTIPLIPKDIFVHLNEIYNNAESGNPILELSHTQPQQAVFLGSHDYGGFIFIRPSFQCMLDVIQPDSPYLIGILIHRYEIPWAKVFPLRLMLRLGAQYRYYPCPHVSMCNRESVYAEIAQTIINFLADFRNYTYTLPFIRGMYIHMEDRQTTVVIPRNRLDDVAKAINNSSDRILAFGGNFSKTADGHLVCMQNVNDDRTEMYAYSTQAINIQGQPRKVTGASFFVLNESLKASSGLSGKCSIVEDGLMVQILPSRMEEVRIALKNQKDVTIICGPLDADDQHTEIVCLKWVDNDKEFNIGVKSAIDERLMDGVSSMRVHASFNYSNSNYAIRLTDIYVIQHEDWYKTNSSTLSASTTSEVTRMTEQIARSTSMALVPFLDLLAASKSTKIGLRATLHQDKVCYEAGARGSKLPPLYMNALDNHLIPTLHEISSGIEESIILELIFYILNV